MSEQVTIKNGRKKDGTFAKGSVPNPHGRPKKEDCFTDIAREILSSKEARIKYIREDGTTLEHVVKADKTLRHAMIIRMLQAGLTGDIHALEKLMDRTDGKVTERVETIDLSNRLEHLTDEELEQRLADLESKTDKITAGRKKAIKAG